MMMNRVPMIVAWVGRAGIGAGIALAARFQLGGIALQHHDHVVDGAADAARKIAGAEGRHHGVLDDQLGVEVGQRAFEAVADLDAHLAVGFDDEQQRRRCSRRPGRGPRRGTAGWRRARSLRRRAYRWSPRRSGRSPSSRNPQASGPAPPRSAGSIMPALSTTRPVSAGSSAASAERGRSSAKESAAITSAKPALRLGPLGATPQLCDAEAEPIGDMAFPLPHEVRMRWQHTAGEEGANIDDKLLGSPSLQLIA